MGISPAGVLVRFAHAICTFGARYAFSASAICFLRKRDMLSPQARYCFALRNSDMFAGGERGGKYANINPRDLAHAVRSRAEGTYRAVGISHANEM